MNKSIDNMFIYRSFANIERHVNHKDFVFVDDNHEVKLNNYSSRVLAIKETPMYDNKGLL
jgi:hypothetical protein